MASDHIFAADIGGTNTRVAILSVGKSVKIVARSELKTSQIVSVNSLINSFLGHEDNKRYHISVGVIGAKGSVDAKGDSILSGKEIAIRRKDIIRHTRLKKVFLLNDLEAQAYGLECTRPKKINGVSVAKDSTKALLNVGTGIGMSIIPYSICEKRHIPIRSEGGHLDFSAKDDFEFSLFEYLKEKSGVSHPDYEQVLSGRGLLNIYEFLEDISASDQFTKEIALLKGDERLEAIRLHYYESDVCRQSVDLFIIFYARIARNLAKVSCCYSGLYITGNIARLYSDKLDSRSFLKHFEEGISRRLRAQIPIFLVEEKDLGLLGCGVFAKHDIRR